MLQACLNGTRRRHEVPGVPETPEDTAASALEAVAAGAEELHVHPRNANGVESLLDRDVSLTVKAIRKALPHIPLGASAGAWIPPGGDSRIDVIAKWSDRPDYVSVNLGEQDFMQVIEAAEYQEIRIEAGVWSVSDAETLVDKVAPERCLRVLVEVPDLLESEALATAAGILARLSEIGYQQPDLLHGVDRSAGPLIGEAFRLGLDTRAGFEDMPVLPDGSATRSNAAIISHAQRMLVGQ